MGIDEMGVDKMRVDEMRVDEMRVDKIGTYHLEHTFKCILLGH